MSTKSRSELNLSTAPVILLAHLLVIALTTLVLVWLLHFREGLAFTSSNKFKIFNIHPLLMIVGFLLVSGEAIMAYKTIPAVRRNQKLFHMIFNFIALAAGIVGVYAVFKYHYEARIPDMYSLHSWFGMSTICLFALQWLAGFLTFWYPRGGSSRRARFAPWHVIFGIIIFFMAIISAISGLVEKFIFLGLKRNQEALVINFTGLLIFLFGISVGVAVLLPRY